MRKLLFALLILVPSIALGADTGFVIAGTGTDADGGYPIWSNPNNITTDNESSYARITLGQSVGTTSNYLRATNFGFSIPTGATINGIEASIHGYGVPPANKDLHAYLIKGNALQTGWTDKGTSTPLNGGAFTLSYGGATDMWGGTLSASDVNSSGFGMGIQMNIVTAGDDKVTDIYWIKIKVYYTDNDTPTPTPSPTITTTPTVTATATATVTQTPTVTATPTITMTPTITLTPTPTWTNAPFEDEGRSKARSRVRARDY
jgi:hypothetical protein